MVRRSQKQEDCLIEKIISKGLRGHRDKGRQIEKIAV